MFLINKIRYDASAKYDIYESRISNYYKCISFTKSYTTKNLTEYIYMVLIQSHLSGVFYGTDISVCDVNEYIRNLYTSYYNYYIKNIINNGNDLIITKDILDSFVGRNKKLIIDTQWILQHTDVSIKLNTFITNIFKKIYTLPSFVYSNERTDINDIFLYLSKLLDFIIDRDINTIILSMALNHNN